MLPPCGNPNHWLIANSLGFVEPALPGEENVSSLDQKFYHISTVPSHRGRKRRPHRSISHLTVWKPQPHTPSKAPRSPPISPWLVQMDTVGSRVIPLTDDGDLWKRHFASADMVIEAVPENLDLKHRCDRTVAHRGQMIDSHSSWSRYLNTADLFPILYDLTHVAGWDP